MWNFKNIDNIIYTLKKYFFKGQNKVLYGNFVWVVYHYI